MTVGGRYFVGGVNAMANEGSRFVTLGRLVPRQGVAPGAFERAHDLVDLHFAETGAHACAGQQPRVLPRLPRSRAV
jgi:hypothetical protein